MGLITTLTGREFNQDTARAKRAARAGPVIITDRGRPAHVLLTIEEYERINGSGPPRTALYAFAGSGVPDHDFAFDPPRREVPGEVDLGPD